MASLDRSDDAGRCIISEIGFCPTYRWCINPLWSCLPHLLETVTHLGDSNVKSCIHHINSNSYRTCISQFSFSMHWSATAISAVEAFKTWSALLPEGLQPIEAACCSCSQVSGAWMVLFPELFENFHSIYAKQHECYNFIWSMPKPNCQWTHTVVYDT